MIAYTSVTLPKGSLGPIGRDECVIILGVVWVTSTFIASFLIDKLGRKSLLIVSSVGCAIATFLAGLWFLLNELTYIDVSGFDWSPFICFVLHG